MRYLQRLPKPDVLIKKGDQWTKSFIASGKDRPDNPKYGHIEIRTQLHNISFKKCFYSEVKFAVETEGQVDHYIEVSEDKNLSFDWENLFLSHKDSNQGKPNNLTIAVTNTLNPFIHSDDEIEEHLTFEDECITARNNSSKGLQTIQKYKLDKDVYNALRSKQLIQFYKVLTVINQNQIIENRKILNDEELEVLKRFAQPDHSFSLMFRILLKKLNL
ncbi:hypothetical protein D3C87_974980 [compost metagenome]